MAKHNVPTGEGVPTIDLERGRPPVHEALARLDAGISRARAAGREVVKVIHGYGSSGVGGTLRDEIRASLDRREDDGRIQLWVAGEDWDLFDPRSRTILAGAPGADRDRDLGRGNAGVSIVLL